LNQGFGSVKIREKKCSVLTKCLPNSIILISVALLLFSIKFHHVFWMIKCYWLASCAFTAYHFVFDFSRFFFKCRIRIPVLKVVRGKVLKMWQMHTDYTDYIHILIYTDILKKRKYFINNFSRFFAMKSTNI
jgi:hypothetical protein